MLKRLFCRKHFFENKSIRFLREEFIDGGDEVKFLGNVLVTKSIERMYIYFVEQQCILCGAVRQIELPLGVELEEKDLLGEEEDGTNSISGDRVSKDRYDVADEADGCCTRI